VIDAIDGHEPAPHDGPRVLLVDDHDLFRTGLRNLLEEQGIQVVAEAGTGADAINLVRELTPDVVVMDFRLPGMDGVETTLALAKECPDVAVVCLTASASPRELDALKAAGAVDCLRKDEELDVIVGAIRKAGESHT
jgi:DNA-binding NarL/FixJ family response regulator